MVTQFKRPSFRVLLASFFAILIFIVLQFVIHVVMPSVSSMVLTAGIDHADRFQIFYWDGLNTPKFHEQRSFFSPEIGPRDKVDIPINMVNTAIRATRLDVGNNPGVVKLYQIRITSHFSRDVILDPEAIMEDFIPGKKDVTMALKEGYVEIQSTKKDPYLFSTKPLLHANPVLLVSLSIFLSITTFVVFLEIDLTQLAAFQDFRSKAPSSGTNIDALDGLRGLAAIMVVGDHTYSRFTGLGATGVWIFMALSGFLLAPPFIKDPSRVFSPTYMGHFFLRRVQRIIPVYYFYITIVFLLTANFEDAIMHYLFLEGSGHLWVIPQEIMFYLAVPVIMGVNFLVFRKNTRFMVVSLLFMTLLANKYLTKEVFSLYGMFQQDLRLYLGVFLTGILFSYLYYSVYIPSLFAETKKKQFRIIFSVTALILLLFMLLFSTARLWGGEDVYAQIYFPWFSAGAGLLIFCLVASDNGFMTRALSWAPLRALSVVSLSLYLFHPLVLDVIYKGTQHFFGFLMHGIPLFLSTLILSYFVACLTYSAIEKSFQENLKSSEKAQSKRATADDTSAALE